ncbi:MAG: putative lipid II flippase FtsW [Chloroflexi bacterium]|nr:putative lipid II flippase FtsW [Chloroflexota bacterium]
MIARREDQRTGKPDYILLGVVAALLVISVNMVYSASFVIAHNSPLYNSDTWFLTRQLLWAGIGSVGLLAMMQIDYHWWRRFTVPLTGIILVLLIVILLTRLGHAAYGAQRWLKLGPLSVQPSELAKLILIMYFADWLSRRRDRMADFSYSSLPFAVTLGTVAGLVLLQPDLGTSFLIVIIGLAMFFIAGADLRYFAAGLALGAAALVPLIALAGYRFRRIVAFLDPQSDPLGVGWHIIQTNIALGSGGLLGLGLGASRQKFYYLPSAHTDSIFAIIGEELGLIGTLTVLALFVLLAYRGYKIILQAPDAFGKLLASGITCWLTFQALLNIAVVTSTIPFTGITLPFVSFGGSSLVVSMAAVGLLLNISKHRPVFRPQKSRHRGAEPLSVEE